MQEENRVAYSINDIIGHMIDLYDYMDGKLPLDINKKFVKNDLGFRVHKSDVAPLIDNKILMELNGKVIVSERGDVYDVKFDESSLWFTVSEI